jgi:acetolactate decarboxylase
MNISFRYVLVATLFLLCATSFQTAQAQPAEKTVYYCPMKCEGEKTYDSAGRCPVCKMKLVPKVVKYTAGEMTNSNRVKIAGTMMHTMNSGDASGKILLDTIKDKTHLYGLGPLENLAGELTVVDGKSFLSTVVSPTKMKVEETFSVKAPFFVYTNIDKWKEVILPDSVETIRQLENFLDASMKQLTQPFAFKIQATVKNAVVHVMNLPKGAVVHSPEEAQKYRQNYSLKNQQVALIGFFSTRHQGIFTHHDSKVHIHLLTADLKQMGHVDDLQLQKGKAKLFVQDL